MKEFKHFELSARLIKRLSAFFPSKIYKTLSPLFYEGQIPISGYLILNGSIQITSKKKLKKIFESGSLIGLNELINKKPSNVSAEVFPNTKVCFLDKSSLCELQKIEDDELQTLLGKLLRAKQ